MPLTNRDRIQAVMAAREDPEFQGSLVDYLQDVRSIVDATYVAPIENQYSFEDEGVYAPPHPGTLSKDDRGLVRRGSDAVVREYRKNVPESFRTILPGFSDVEDAMYVKEQFGKEGSWGGRAIAAGALALPIVGAKVLDPFLRKSKKFAFESIPNRKYKVGNNLETDYRSSHFLPKQDVYEFNKHSFIAEGTDVETKLGDLRVRRHFNNEIVKQKFLDYGGAEADFNKVLDNINPETLITYNPPSGAAGVTTEGRAFVWRNPYKNLETSEDLVKMKNTLIHEKYHQSKIVADTREESLLPNLYDDLEKLSGVKSHDFPEGSFSRYANDPGEIYSRMGEIRAESGLKEREKFTKESLENAMGISRDDTGKIISYKRHLPSYKGNEKKWLELMNYAPIVAAIGVGYKTINNNK